MARVIKANGEEYDVTPNNGTDFSLEELQGVVGGYIEIVYVDEGIMVLNEEGKLIGLEMNMKASEMYGDLIVGDVLVCDSSQVK